MAIRETLLTLAEKFRDGSRIKLVFGDPMEIKGKTVIPVASFGYGFGIGGDFPKDKEGDDSTSGHESGGGGGGGGAEPLGVFEFTELYTRFIPVIRVREILIAVTIMVMHYNVYRMVKAVFGRKKK